MQEFGFKVFLFLIFLLRKMPKFLRRGIFSFLSKVLYVIGRKPNKVVESNLKFVFDDISNDEIKQIQKYSYYNMLLWGQSLIEHLDINKDEIKNKVEVENQEYFDKLRQENKKVIIISSHFGNMEVLSSYINMFITPLVQVARQSKNPRFDEFLTKSREKSGAKIVYRKGALKQLVRAMMKNEVVSLIIDQHVNKRNGIEVEFLGKKAYQTTSTATLARKFEAYIVPVAVFNQGEDKYKIKFYEPISPCKSDDEQADILKSSQDQADALSKIILEDKKQWFWLHKRFKGFYDEIYK